MFIKKKLDILHNSYNKLILIFVEILYLKILYVSHILFYISTTNNSDLWYFSSLTDVNNVICDSEKHAPQIPLRTGNLTIHSNLNSCLHPLYHTFPHLGSTLCVFRISQELVFEKINNFLYQPINL